MACDAELRTFVDAAAAAYGAQVQDPRGRASVGQIFEMLKAPLEIRHTQPERLAVCDLLEDILRPEQFSKGVLRDLVRAFKALEPHLKWRMRAGDSPNANAAYEYGHALSRIVGPGGLVPHDQLYLGVSLQGPGVRYPDHTHPPEETYLVLSDGEFSQDGVTWFTPGVGGTFYNPPGILHAMRSADTPLFAMWALKVIS